jgi:hypothetical protein
MIGTCNFNKLAVVSCINQRVFNSSSAQQSVHWTLGILRDFRAFFWLRVFSAPKPCPRPPPAHQVIFPMSVDGKIPFVASCILGLFHARLLLMFGTWILGLSCSYRFGFSLAPHCVRCSAGVASLASPRLVSAGCPNNATDSISFNLRPIPYRQPNNP